MKKFCCAKLQGMYEAKNEMGFNFRICIHFEDSEVAKPRLVFLLTEGYDETSIRIKTLIIQRCPFCGAKLARFYSKEQANEDVLRLLAF